MELNTIATLVVFKNRLIDLNIKLEKENFELMRQSLLKQHHEILEKEMKFIEAKQKKALLTVSNNKEIYHMLRNELKNRNKFNTTVQSSDLGQRIEKCEERFGVFDSINAVNKEGLNNLENTLYTLKHNQYVMNEGLE